MFIFIRAGFENEYFTHVVKSQINGTELWNKTFTGNHSQYSPTITQNGATVYYVIIESGGIIIHSFSASNGTSAFLIRVNSYQCWNDI